MKHRDLVLEQIRHRETRPVPYTLDIEDEVAVKLDAHFGNKDWRDRIQNSIYYAGVVDTMRKDPTDRAGFERWKTPWLCSRLLRAGSNPQDRFRPVQKGNSQDESHLSGNPEQP